MLTLSDSRTGQAGPVRSARRGQLQTYLASPAEAGAVTPADLRAALAADLVRRVAERHHLLVSAWQHDPADAAGRLRAACDALNIHPAQFCAELPEPLDVVVTAGPAGSLPPAAQAGPGAAVWLRPADVPATESGAGTEPGTGALPGHLTARGLDPLALRLVFLRHHHQRPVTLGWDALAAADRLLRDWRWQVADWACSPSKAMCARYVDDVTVAFDRDLDTPAALAVLEALAADEQVLAGSKFETFAHLDQLFGLDLARQVGR